MFRFGEFNPKIPNVFLKCSEIETLESQRKKVKLLSRIRLFATPWTVAYQEVAQSYPTLYDPMDCSLPGFSIHGIFQARILEWITISFSRGSS